MDPGGATAVGLAGFSLRPTPAVVSAHLGPLPISSPTGLVLALFELGPVILFTPWITRWAWRRLREGEWVFGVWILSAWAAFGIPLLVAYQSESDIARVTEHAVMMWTVMLGIMLWDSARGLPRALRPAAAMALLLVSLDGAVLAASTVSAASQQTLSYKIEYQDALIHREVWDTLPPEALVFDPQGWRATALTGRLTRAVTGDLSFGNLPSQTWINLKESPSPQGFLEAGYQFLYVDERWWWGLSAAERGALDQPCVQQISAYQDESGEVFRRMLDLRGCAP
jgi:hypothetical protein